MINLDEYYKQTEKIEMPVQGGILVAYKSVDPMFPGIHVDFIADENSYVENVVTVEKPMLEDETDNKDTSLRAFFWRKDDENCTFQDPIIEINWENGKVK